MVVATEQTAQQRAGGVMPESDIIMRAQQVTKIYPGTVALNKVDYAIHRGKVNVLVGENGAGKSTLMKILAGVEPATEGKLLLEGKPVKIGSIFDAEAHGIGIIFQELNLFPNLSVAENIFMAHELMGPTGINHGEQERRTAALLARLEQPITPNTLVGSLRIGQQQIVEIAKALSQDISILIMDEPTSALSVSEVEVLFRIIEELKEQGVSIIYISHKLEELMQIGDYITVLRDGNLVANAPMDDIDLGWIVAQMVGRDTQWEYHPPKHDFGDTVLEVIDLALPRPSGAEGYLLDHVSLSLQAGEIVGIYGLMGAGRTELFETLLGLHPHATGSVKLNGKELKGNRLAQRIEAGVMLIPEDRQRDGLVQKLSVKQNMILASLHNYLSRFYLSNSKEDVNVQRLIKELAIKVSDPNNLISSLSGGNQQKVVVAKALLTEPEVLLMDEPTRGIDVGAKEEILEIMRQLAAQGLGIIFVSTELKEVMAMADRILVMSKGRITKAFNREEASEEALVAASAIGHELVKGA